MNNAMELNEIIYSLLTIQIEFGAYRHGDTLPKMEDAAQWLCVSLDTVRSAYLRLKQDGSIRLSKHAGATVIVQYSVQETETHIQTFFSDRRTAVLDLCSSLVPLFCHVQWSALKAADARHIDKMEQLFLQRDIPPVFIVSRYLQLIFSTLNNALLMRLAWHAFMFIFAPLLTASQNNRLFEECSDCLLHMLALCRKKDWTGLYDAVETSYLRFACAIRQCYDTQITKKPSGHPVSFQWHVYQKSNQRCYSLAMELLCTINRSCSAGDFLPSPSVLSKENGVSVSTIRRTLSLLNQLGATRSINGIGTQVLKTENSAQNCDFSQTIIQKRLIDFTQSLHILRLTCRTCAETTFSTMTPADFRRCREQLEEVKSIQKHESVVFISLGFIARFAPSDAVRGIYGQLRQVLLWGYPLRGIHGSRETINAFYLPFMDSISHGLDHCDAYGLAAKLERLMEFELSFAVKHLDRLGISETLVPF